MDQAYTNTMENSKTLQPGLLQSFSAIQLFYICIKDLRKTLKL